MIGVSQARSDGLRIYYFKIGEMLNMEITWSLNINMYDKKREADREEERKRKEEGKRESV